MPKEKLKEKLEEKLKINTVKQWMEHLNKYRVLFFMWLILGLVTLILGETSRISYACVWVLLLLEYLARSMEE